MEYRLNAMMQRKYGKNGGEAMWNVSSSNIASSTNKNHIKTILLESSNVNNSNNHIIDATTIGTMPSDESVQIKMLWPALRASKKRSNKKILEYNPMSNSANSNTNDTNDDDNNNNNIVEDGGLTIVSSNKIYQSQNEASSSYHRTPTPPSSKAFNDRKRFPSRKNSIIKDETTAVTKNKPLASQKPHIRKRINNRNHLHQQYTFNNGVLARRSEISKQRPASPLQGWKDLEYDDRIDLSDNNNKIDCTNNNWHKHCNSKSTTTTKVAVNTNNKISNNKQQTKAPTTIVNKDNVKYRIAKQECWWNNRNIWSEDNEIEIYNVDNDYNYITLTTKKAKRNTLNKLHIRALNRRLRRHSILREKRNNNKNKKNKNNRMRKLNSKHYTRSSTNSRFYIKTKHLPSNLDNETKATSGNTSNDDNSKIITAKQRQLQQEKRQKQKLMEEERLTLIKQLREARQEKRDSVTDKTNNIREKSIENIFHTRMASSTNEDLHEFTLARKQLKRNSPLKEDGIRDVDPIVDNTNDVLSVPKHGSKTKMSAMDRLFINKLNNEKRKMASGERKEHKNDDKEPTTNGNEEYFIDDVESLTYQRV